MIVAVLSESTEAYDRGEKFEHYRAIESMTDYILVSQDKVQVTVAIGARLEPWITAASRTGSN